MTSGAPTLPSGNALLYRSPTARSWRTTPITGVIDFHRTLPGYAPTRLVELPAIAAELGVARVFMKEECERLGLPAFKILGASYAVVRALANQLGFAEEVLSLDGLRTSLAEMANHRPLNPIAPIRLVAATDGNHGRAVAHMARLLDLPATIFYPLGITDDAVAGIRSEGAETLGLDLPYDDVVAHAERFATQPGTQSEEGAERGEVRIHIQDTAWPGYEQIPQWIVDGYSTLLEECDTDLRGAGVTRLDLVAVPSGVGSFAQAVVRHYRSTEWAPTLLSVEPTSAPAIIESLHAGHSLTVQTGSTIMSGLNCGTPSSLAWPILQSGVDLAIALPDSEAARAVHDLLDAGVDVGPCGASTLAGIRALARHEDLPHDAVVLLLSTEAYSANPLPPGM